MMKHMVARILLIVGAFASLAGAAQAAIVMVTFSGVVADGADADGTFGAVGADLTGVAFVATYRFDTMLGNRVSDAVSTDIPGGSRYGLTTPVLSASLTINGQTIDLTGVYFGEIFSQVDDQSQFYVDAEDSRDIGLSNYLEPGGPAGAWATLSFADFDGDVSAVDGSGGFYTANTLLDFTNQHLTIQTEAAAVPEPASWALMIGGFGLGLIGGTMRRRRVAVRFA